MVISQFGKIIRIDTKSVRSAGRSTSGVKLLDLDSDDKVAAAVVIPSKKPKPNPKRERFCSNFFCGGFAVFARGFGKSRWQNVVF
jgi:DNA gyrase/topoisomerase IV subunit A